MTNDRAKDFVEKDNKRFRVSAGQISLDVQGNGGGRRREYQAQFVQAGRIRAAGGRPGQLEITADCIVDLISRKLFDGAAMFVDHAGVFDHPSLAKIAGYIQPGSVVWNEDRQAALGSIKLYPTPAGEMVNALFDAILEDAAGGATPNVGLSMVFWPEKWRTPDDPKDPIQVLQIRHIESVDFVFEPAAEGRIREILSSLDRDSFLQTAISNCIEFVRQDGDCPDPYFSYLSGGLSMADLFPKKAGNDSTSPAVNDDVQQGGSQYLTSAEGWASAMQQAAVPAILSASGLPAASCERLAGQSFASPNDLEQAIQTERRFLARLQEDNVIRVGGTPPRQPDVVLGRSGIEQVTLAAGALIDGVRPPDGIRPLTGIRELYHLLSGDFEMSGVFRPERVYLANVTTATMASMVANALNKRVVNLFQQYPRWWEPVVSIQDFDSLQDVRWITLGGVGELPTVSEGAAYSELTWDDQTETDSFVKKGGYLGITLEAIDKDETYKLRAAPRALAQAAWLTLSKSVSAIFTDNSGLGPAMSDSNYLFDASHHGNLLTDALSWTAYKAVRTAMRKQTELNSGERLGALTAPKFLLVPPDLEITALQVLASEGEPGTADNDVNPMAEGNVHDERLRSARRRVIVVDLWTDTNNWAAAADPLLYPAIGLGFRYGRTPEIFSVASPTAGLMFSNDVMPVKVRFFFAVGPTDWRGLHKNNVS